MNKKIYKLNISNFLSYLQTKEIYYLTSFIFLSIINSFLELISIASIIPILDIFFNEGSFTQEYLSFLNFSSLININLFTVITILIIFFIIKYIISFSFQYLLIKFTSDIQYRVENTIYKIILSQNYNFFLEKNTSSLLRDIQNCSIAFPRIINSLITIFSEILLIFLLSLLLIFYVGKEIAFVAIFFVPLIFLFIKFTKNFVTKIGTSLHNFSKSKIESIKSSLDGILEVKVFKIESNIKSIFEKYSHNTINSLMRVNQIQIMPRYILELSLILMLIITAYLMRLNDVSIEKIFTFIALLMASAFRVMPSMSKIINSFQMINFHSPAMPSLIYYLNFNINKKRNTKLQNYRSIEFSDLEYKYPNSNSVILKNINLRLVRNSKIAISGKSGSGKTTLIKLIIGLLQPTQGVIKVNNKKHNYQNDNLNIKISYVPQNVYLFDDTILSNIVMNNNIRKIDYKRLNKIIKIVQLSDFINSSIKEIKTFIGENGSRVSGGQRQRIGIARALYINPDLLILDEATNSIDQENQNKILENIFNEFKNISIICISHDSKVLQKFKNKYTLKNGTLYK